jgi:hypothetical protein
MLLLRRRRRQVLLLQGGQLLGVCLLRLLMPQGRRHSLLVLLRALMKRKRVWGTRLSVHGPGAATVPVQVPAAAALLRAMLLVSVRPRLLLGLLMPQWAAHAATAALLPPVQGSRGAATVASRLQPKAREGVL